MLYVPSSTREAVRVLLRLRQSAAAATPVQAQRRSGASTAGPTPVRAGTGAARPHSAGRPGEGRKPPGAARPTPGSGMDDRDGVPSVAPNAGAVAGSPYSGQPRCNRPGPSPTKHAGPAAPSQARGARTRWAPAPALGARHQHQRSARSDPDRPASTPARTRPSLTWALRASARARLPPGEGTASTGMSRAGVAGPDAGTASLGAGTAGPGVGFAGPRETAGAGAFPGGCGGVCC
jgi:hypothetical protein